MTSKTGGKAKPGKSGAVDLTEQELDSAVGGQAAKAGSPDIQEAGKPGGKPEGFWESLPADLQVVKR